MLTAYDDLLIQLNEATDLSDLEPVTGTTPSDLIYTDEDLAALMVHLDELAANEAGKIDSKRFPAHVVQTQQNKGQNAHPRNPGQCVKSIKQNTPHTSPTHSPLHTPTQSPLPHTHLFKPTTPPANAPEQPKIRKPRGKLARIAEVEGMVSNGMRWNGKRKGDPKAIGEAGKYSVAVASVEAVGGHAFSLNLGSRREDMLLSHSDPRRRMSQNLNNRLKEAGFAGLPYAFAFDVEPKSDRVHLHGVIDTRGLSSDDLKRLDHALRRAGSEASGALGGERQVMLKDVNSAGGWVDYTLRAQRRAQEVLGVENAVFISTPMNRLSKQHFEALRGEYVAGKQV